MQKLFYYKNHSKIGLENTCTKTTKKAIKSAYENYSKTRQFEVRIKNNVGLPIDRFKPFKTLQNITRIGHKNHCNNQNNKISAQEEQKNDLDKQKKQGSTLILLRSTLGKHGWIHMWLRSTLVSTPGEPGSTWWSWILHAFLPVSFPTSNTGFRHFQIELSYEIWHATTTKHGLWSGKGFTQFWYETKGIQGHKVEPK